MTDILVVEKLNKVFQKGENKVHALSGVNLKIKKGEFVAIMGPSGSGKTTLLNIIGCLDKSTKGNVLLDGKNIEEKRLDLFFNLQIYYQYLMPLKT